MIAFTICVLKKKHFLNKLGRISDSDNQFSEGYGNTQNMMAQMKKILEGQKNVFASIMKCIDTKIRQFLLTIPV